VEAMDEMDGVDEMDEMDGVDEMDEMDGVDSTRRPFFLRLSLKRILLTTRYYLRYSG
jgi:hypothetical protein